MRIAALHRLTGLTSVITRSELSGFRTSFVRALQSCRAPDSLFSPELVQSRHDRLRELLRASDGGESIGIAAVQPRIKALLIDAAGTLIQPSEPAAAVYLRYAAPYGCKLTEVEILENFRRAFNEPWTQSVLKYDGEARQFWRHIVGQATDCHDDEMHEAIYSYFGRAAAWTVNPSARNALRAMRIAGYRLALVSNFDTRLRLLLDELQLTELFDAILVSAEVGIEKPNPVIFEKACAQLGVDPAESLVIGDDRRNDIAGGRDAGCNAWLFGVDVQDFDEALDRLHSGKIF